MRKWMRFEEDLPLVHVACVWFNYLACISSTWRRCPSGPLMLPIPVVLRLWVGLLCVWLYCACALVWFVACLPLLWAGRCVTDVSEPGVYVVSLWWDVWPSECCHHHDSPLWNQKFISLLFHRNWCLVLAQDVVISFYGCPWSGLFLRVWHSFCTQTQKQSVLSRRCCVQSPSYSGITWFRWAFLYQHRGRPVWPSRLFLLLLLQRPGTLLSSWE